MSEEKLALKPRALRAGELIGVAAPAGPVDEAKLTKGCKALARMGYRVRIAPSILDRDHYFAGSIERRVAELHALAECQDVRAILYARGGYGSTHLLPHLDLQKLTSARKIIAGYSDATALLAAVQSAELVCFHAPMAAIDFARAGGVDEASWRAVLGGEEYANRWTEGITTLRAGAAEAPLTGGCLSLLTSSLGTPFEFEAAGSILFIEDVNVRVDQIDRMLTQLRLAGKFEGVKGLIVGATGLAIDDVKFALAGVLASFDGPVAVGLPAGHNVKGNLTLPFGSACAMKATRGGLRLAFERATEL